MTEQEFLKEYNPNDYPGLAVCVDVVALGVSWEKQGYHRLNAKAVLHTLLVKRADFPCKGKLAFPGGFVAPDELLEEAARRVLKAKTGIEEAYLEQLYTFDAIDRDPRTRVVSVVFLALVSNERFLESRKEPVDTSELEEGGHGWVPVKFSKAHGESGETLSLQGLPDMAVSVRNELIGVAREVYSIESPSVLAFDHDKILLDALVRVRNKFEYTDVVFGLLPETFTIDQYSGVCENFTGAPMGRPGFKRRFSGRLIETGETSTGAGHPKARLYKYNPEWRTKLAVVDAALRIAYIARYKRMRQGEMTRAELDAWHTEGKAKARMCNEGQLDSAEFMKWLAK